MKRVSLGFFNKNNIGELSAAATTDLSFMEMYAMNMVNTVVNGYITVIVLILFLAFIFYGGRNCSGWCPFVCPVFFICWRRAVTKMRLSIKTRRTIWWKVSIEYLRGGCRW